MIKEEALTSVDGFGYVLICSCGEIVEIPPTSEHATAESAREAAHRQWEEHSQLEPN
jgi:hypothetical protein